jgi:hypothetical protein
MGKVIPSFRTILHGNDNADLKLSVVKKSKGKAECYRKTAELE